MPAHDCLLYELQRKRFMEPPTSSRPIADETSEYPGARLTLKGTVGPELDAVALMGSASESFASFDGVVDAWENRAHSATAWQRYVNRHPHGSVKPLGGPIRPADSGAEKRLARVWMAKPWKWRVETSMPAEPHLALVIVNSGEWWLSDGAGEVATNQGSVTCTPDARGLD
jgi:hypothetical protein